MSIPFLARSWQKKPRLLSGGIAMTTAQAEEIVNHPLEATAAWLSDVASDPVAFVEGALPWRQGELSNFDGPMEWQRWVLEQIRDKRDWIARDIAEPGGGRFERMVDDFFCLSGRHSDAPREKAWFLLP